MLLQICRHPVGSIDGLRLESFRPGITYDIGPQLGAIFMAEGWAEPVTSEVAHPTQRPPPEGVGAVIMVVDDQEELRRFTIRLLSAYGYGVVEAQHGRQAIERLREFEPALVLLDLNMPVMNGWEFCAELQRLEDERLAAIPVVLVTGEAEDDRRYQAELRAVGLIRKPFEPERLLNTIHDALQR
jgi:CheY-like chemotaxis protein